MPDINGEINLSHFLSDNGIPVPDNQTPDTKMGSTIKEWIVNIMKVEPEKVVNEASLSADLHMTFFKFMRLLGKLNKTFHLNSAILDAKTKNTRKLVAKDVKNSKNFPLVLPTVGELTAFYVWMSKPDRGYLVFNMKEALLAAKETLREREKANKWLPDDAIQYINNIPDDIAIEDLPIYRDYLSKFTPSLFFRDKRLLTTADDRISKDDGDLLFKMICGTVIPTTSCSMKNGMDGKSPHTMKMKRNLFRKKYTNCIKPAGTALRRALCERNGEIIVVECDNITFHDFAQTLADFNVQNAIYLMGADAYGFYRMDNERVAEHGNVRWNQEPNVTYIVWK